MSVASAGARRARVEHGTDDGDLRALETAITCLISRTCSGQLERIAALELKLAIADSGEEVGLEAGGGRRIGGTDSEVGEDLGLVERAGGPRREAGGAALQYSLARLRQRPEPRHQERRPPLRSRYRVTAHPTVTSRHISAAMFPRHPGSPIAAVRATSPPTNERDHHSVNSRTVHTTSNYIPSSVVLQRNTTLFRTDLVGLAQAYIVDLCAATHKSTMSDSASCAAATMNPPPRTCSSTCSTAGMSMRQPR